MISESKPLATKLGALNKYGILKYCVKTKSHQCSILHKDYQIEKLVHAWLSKIVEF